MVRAVDDREVDRRPTQTPGREKPAEPGADDHDTVSLCAGFVAIHRGCSSLLWRLVVGSVTIRASDAREAVSRAATIRPRRRTPRVVWLVEAQCRG
jgi:hypothetical protein